MFDGNAVIDKRIEEEIVKSLMAVIHKGTHGYHLNQIYSSVLTFITLTTESSLYL